MSLSRASLRRNKRPPGTSKTKQANCSFKQTFPETSEWQGGSVMRRRSSRGGEHSAPFSDHSDSSSDSSSSFTSGGSQSPTLPSLNPLHHISDFPAYGFSMSRRISCPSAISIVLASSSSSATSSPA